MVIEQVNLYNLSFDFSNLHPHVQKNRRLLVVGKTGVRGFCLFTSTPRLPGPKKIVVFGAVMASSLSLIGILVNFVSVSESMNWASAMAVLIVILVKTYPFRGWVKMHNNRFVFDQYGLIFLISFVNSLVKCLIRTYVLVCLLCLIKINTFSWCLNKTVKEVSAPSPLNSRISGPQKIAEKLSSKGLAPLSDYEVYSMLTPSEALWSFRTAVFRIKVYFICHYFSIQNSYDVNLGFLMPSLMTTTPCKCGKAENILVHDVVQVNHKGAKPLNKLCSKELVISDFCF